VVAAALAARRWIVATRVGGIAEQLRGQAGAVLCDIDAGSVAEGVRRLLDDPPPVDAMTPPDWRRDAARLAEGLAEIVRK
jgi:glycosyltransferase involved in cell wall biosynthesis